jgi:hypothetical protein
MTVILRQECPLTLIVAMFRHPTLLTLDRSLRALLPTALNANISESHNQNKGALLVESRALSMQFVMSKFHSDDRT